MKKMMDRKITYAEAVLDAAYVAMDNNPDVIYYGLGVPDPKAIFGTTLGLAERFGDSRVFDMPTAENGMTGIAIGAALNGLRPVMVHQRFDFFLLAMDQLVNNAAKWHYMFGGDKQSVPITVRLIIGRGWGQGPTHSQALHSWFAHVPGLKVVLPTTPSDAKGLMLSAIYDDNPTLIIEHRWLHNQIGVVPEGDFRCPMDKAEIRRNGNDITIVAVSYMVVEALKAAEFLERNCGISCQIIDLRSVNPIDWNTVYSGVGQTGRLLVLDIGWGVCSIASEIISGVSEHCFDMLKNAPVKITLPNYPTPTSSAMTRHYYRRAEDVVFAVGQMFEIDIDVSPLIDSHSGCWDTPGNWFKGPF